MKNKKHWSAVIEAYTASGLTQREFCLREEISLESFKWQLRRSRNGAGVAVGFARLSVSAPDLAATVPGRAVPTPVQQIDVVELHLPGGMFLRFGSGIAPSYLRELSIALRP